MRSALETEILLKILDSIYGEVATFLNHGSPFQLLVAVILSAQTTDVLVNRITPALFMKYPDAAALKKASVAEIEKFIDKVNYYHTKAKNLQATSMMIDEIYAGRVPDSMNELVLLPGVGRKVANVILAEVFKKEAGIVVDTHVKRVAYRVGWSDSNDPKKVELDLMQQWPKNSWVNTPKQIILIGRTYCFASKKPDCEHCPLRNTCWKRIIE